MAVDCTALKADLDAAKARLADMRAKSGIRSVQDSDGSRVEYSFQAIAMEESNVRRLEAQYETVCENCRASRPYGYWF